MNLKGQLFILTGPSGVGKSTVEARVREHVRGLAKVITYTTREPRPHEKNGVHYHFVSERTFKEMLHAGEFLESAQVYAHHYGNTKQAMMTALQSGHVLMILDVQGAATIKRRFPEHTHVIFLQPDSIQSLQKHLHARVDSDPNDAKARLAAAEKELARAQEFDFVVTNKEGKIEQTVTEIAKIIQNVEKARRS